MTATVLMSDDIAGAVAADCLVVYILEDLCRELCMCNRVYATSLPLEICLQWSNEWGKLVAFNAIHTIVAMPSRSERVNFRSRRNTLCRLFFSIPSKLLYKCSCVLDPRSASVTGVNNETNQLRGLVLLHFVPHW